MVASLNSYPAIGAAMAEQVRRVNRANAEQGGAEPTPALEHQLQRALDEIAALRQRIAELEQENDTLLQRFGRRRVRTEVPGDMGILVEGRRAVNQVEAARILGVEQYQISRWVKAGHFTLVSVEWRKQPLIIADSLYKPTPRTRGRKPKQS